MRWCCTCGAITQVLLPQCLSGWADEGRSPVCHPPRPSRLAAVPTTYLKLHYPFPTALHQQGGPTTFPTHYVNPDIATCDLSCAHQLCTVPPFGLRFLFLFNFPARLPVLVLRPLVSKPPPPSYSIRVSFVCLWLGDAGNGSAGVEHAGVAFTDTSIVDSTALSSSLDRVNLQQ